MDQTEDKRPRRARASSSYLRDVYRDSKPRRVYIEDDDATTLRPRVQETLWRADAHAPVPPPRPDGSDVAARSLPPSREDVLPAERPAHAEPSEDPATTPGFGSTVGYTLLSTIIPGLGLIGSRQRGVRWVGVGIAAACTATVAAAAVVFSRRVHPDPGEHWLHAAASAAVGVISGRGALHVLTVVIAAVALLWVALIAGTHIVTRARNASGGKRVVGAALVAVLSLAVAAPLAVGANYAQVLAASLAKTFTGNVVSDSQPTLATQTGNPFKDIPRLNILLLGSDLDESRREQYDKMGWGFRTDSIILASIDTTTGETALIQIPRNVPRTPFPEGSEMAKQFPDGWRGDGDPAEWYVNTIWEKASVDYPDLFKGQTYPGAEALKQGVEGITGLKVHYFLMLNIDGLRNLVDAMGGVTVNINERLPMGGSSKNQGATWGWLEPGPNQHLDGLRALWYARSRWSTDDYSRMQRQSCLIKAITDQANPGTLLTRFEAIAGASSDMVHTDIPPDALEALTNLALKTQRTPMKRLVFVNGSNGYNQADPDFDVMHERVAALINPPAKPSTTPSASTDPGDAEPSPSASSTKKSNEGSQDIADACAYNPVDGNR